MYLHSIRNKHVSSSDSVLTADCASLDLPFNFWEGQGFFSSLLTDMRLVSKAVTYVTQHHNFWCSQKNLIHIHMQTCAHCSIFQSSELSLWLYLHRSYGALSVIMQYSAQQNALLYFQIFYFTISVNQSNMIWSLTVYRYFNTEYPNIIRVHFVGLSAVWFHYDVAFLSCVLCLHGDILIGATERLSLEWWNQETNVTHSSNSPPTPYTWLSITCLLII
jgi:hypothetical protein